jgi:leucyl aminopeptidase
MGANMDIKVINASLHAASADAILVNLFEGDAAPTGGTGSVDKALNGAISELLHTNDFETAVIYSRGAVPAPRVILIGLGKVEDFSTDRIRQASATGAKKARELGCNSIATSVFGAERLELSLAAQAVVEGALLGLYRWRTNHTDTVDRADIETLTLVESDAAKIGGAEAGIRAGSAVAAGVTRARDWSTSHRTT